MAQCLDFTIVDALTKTPFTGSPTPVLILDHLKPWPKTTHLQKIAREMNHSETMVARYDDSKDSTTYDIRCFTPSKEIGFCGHGIFSVAVILKEQCSGEVYLRATDGRIAKAILPPAREEYPIGSPSAVELFVPSYAPDISLNDNFTLRRALARVLGINEADIDNLATNNFNDLVIEVSPDVDISASSLLVDAVALDKISPPGTRSQIITSNGSKLGFDYVKRVFWEGDEDQATGSTQCALVPYWSHKLGKSEMKTKQLSYRTSEVEVRVDPTGATDFVTIIGTGIKMMEGRVFLSC